MSAGKRFLLFWTAIGVLGALRIGAWIYPGGRGMQTDGKPAIRVPQLSTVAVAGRRAFDAVCASCHGTNALGTDKGPPLIGEIYNPGHHGDAAFMNAVRSGTRQHHWRFGDMPAQPGVSDEQVRGIVRYVRELQEANGIRFQPHTM